MPSEKRARQRAYRDQKRAIEEQRRRRRRKVRGLGSMGIGLVVVVGLIVLFVELSGSSTPKKAAAKATTTTVHPTTTTPAKSPPSTAPVSHVAVAPVCPPATPAGAAKRVIAFTKAPPICISMTATYEATVETDVGTFVIKMAASASPAAVNNFVFLARYHFYDGVDFHRVIPGFVIQGGDPTGTGSGGPGYEFTGNLPPASCTAKKDCYPSWGVAMADSGTPSSDGSQFFIVLPGGGAQLGRDYTLFGQVISGMSVLDKIAADGNSNPADSGVPPKVLHYMQKVTITEVPGSSSGATSTASTTSSPAAGPSGASTSTSSSTATSSSTSSSTTVTSSPATTTTGARVTTTTD